MTLSHHTSHDIAITASLAEECGIKTSCLLEGTGITARSIADPYTRVSTIQQRLLLLNLSRLLDTPEAAMTLGSQIGVQQLGPVGLAIQSCASTRDSSAIVNKYQALLGWLPKVTHYFNGGTAIAALNCNEKDATLARFLIERALASIQRIGQDIRTLETPPKLIRLQFSRSGQHRLYEQFFECPVEFDCDRSEIHYDAPSSGTPQRTADHRVNRSLVRLLDDLVLEMKAPDDIAAQLELILQQHQREYPSLNQVAQQLSMSPRTLSRQLTSRGTRYREILDKVRKQQALEKLKNPNISIYEVGVLCGFKDPASFLDAFKRWTGYPPSHFRP